MDISEIYSNKGTQPEAFFTADILTCHTGVTNDTIEELDQTNHKYLA